MLFEKEVEKIKASLRDEHPQDINYTNPNKLVRTGTGELITWAESVRRVESKIDDSFLYKTSGIRTWLFS